MRFVGLFAFLAAGAMLGFPQAWGADDASSPSIATIEIGTPVRIEVFPSSIALTSARREAQLVVTGHYADGSLQDLTRSATITSPNVAIARIEGGRVLPTGDGTVEVIVEVGGHRQSIPTTVSNFAIIEPISFENGALVALSKQNCNTGACHGSPSGKGGFRLSLRAFDAKLDELTLIREEFGRRTNVMEPEESLLLLKPLMKRAHGGGLQIRKSDHAYGVLKDWIAEGAKTDPPGTPRCVKLEIYPSTKRVLKFPAHTQQIAVVAHFSDGSKKDVTSLAAYSSSATSVASVSADGLVVAQDRGESAIIVRYLEHIESLPLMFIKEVENFAWTDPPVNNYVDEKVHDKLKQLKYIPSATSNDSEFLRRVYLDVIGLLPTVQETEAFLADTDPNKRAKVIDTLLDRPEYAKFWALKWGDLLRMTSKKVTDEGVYKYHRWVEKAFRDNMPYDQFARELLGAQGSTLSNPPANFYRTAADVNECVETISQVFLGARLQCAKCHNHPFERWTQDNYYGLAAFFDRVQRKKTERSNEVFVWVASQGEVTQPRTGQVMRPWLPSVGSLEKDHETDRRVDFVDWLTQKENPYFAKIEVNRIWSNLFSRGIVDPIDDFRDSNPPSNVELLDALAKDFSDHNFDRKHILRTILNSRTYQASFEANPLNSSDTQYFSHQEPRLLSAEQLLDAVCQSVGVFDQYGSLPAGTRATQLPAPDLVKSDFLKVFGQPERSTVCACERSSETNLGMAIEFFNGSLIYDKLKKDTNRFRTAITAGKTDEEIVKELYMAALCRPPTPDEWKAASDHIAGRGDRVAAMEDICWVLLNTDEFLFQH